MTAIPSVLVRRWLAAVLLDDPELADLGVTDVVEGRATKANQYPLIVISEDAPFTTVSATQRRDVISQGNLRIRVVDRTDQLEAVAPAAARLHDLLRTANGTTIAGGGEIGSCLKLRDHLQQTVEGEAYTSLGGVYRITLTLPL